MTDQSGSGGNVGRRTVLKGLGASAAAASLAGCSGGNQGGEGTEATGTTMGDTSQPSLDVWLGYYTEGETKKKYTDELVSQFESDTGITVNLTGVPYADMVTKFRAARASGELPDMVEVMTNPGVITGGAGRPVNELFESMELADVVTDKVMGGHEVWGQQATGEEGAIVTIPLGIRPYFSVWRTDWLEQAGIDRSEVNYEAGSLSYQDDLPDIYRRLQDTELGQQDGFYPDSTGFKRTDEEYMSLYIPQYGGSKTGVVKEDGSEAAINSPEAIEAIKMQVDFIEQGFFDANALNIGDEESTTKHWAGKVAANHIQDSTDLWGDYLENQEQAMKDLDYAWGLPYNGGTQAALTWLPSLGFIDDQFQSQAKLDAAGEFLDYWVADSDNAVKNAKNLGFVPANSEALRNEEFFAQTEMHERFWRGACLKTLEEFETASIPAVPGNTAITYDIPNKMHQRIMSQDMPVEEAANKAAEEINDVLERRRSG